MTLQSTTSSEMGKSVAVTNQTDVLILLEDIVILERYCSRMKTINMHHFGFILGNILNRLLVF